MHASIPSLRKMTIVLLLVTENNAHQLRVLKVVSQVIFPSCQVFWFLQLRSEMCIVFPNRVRSREFWLGLAGLSRTDIQRWRRKRRMAAEIKEAVLSVGTFQSQHSAGCFCLIWVRASRDFRLWVYSMSTICWYYHLLILCAGSTSNKLFKLQNDSKTS